MENIVNQAVPGGDVPVKQERVRVIIYILAALLVVSLLASGILWREVSALQRRADGAEAVVGQMSARVEMAEKSLQSVSAEQDRMTARMEEHLLAMESLEKGMMELRERLGSLERAFDQHQHRGQPAPQLG